MINYKNIITVLLMILFSIQIKAEGDQKNKTNKLNKTNGQPEYAQFNINKISTWIKNDGEADINPNGNSGFLFPKESNKGAFFQSGFLYGGVVDGQIRVGGSTYNQGQVPGRILEDGSAEERNLPHVRIYRVRRDYKTADLSHELLVRDTTIGNFLTHTTYTSVSESYKQYEKDWDEWPAEFGAPFEDINRNGIYEPSIDIPGEPGADQTIWFVANDLDEEACKNLYGSKPIGIEMQVTVWGYKDAGFLSNVLYKRIVLINKSGKKITDFYLSMWADPDIGDATNDFSGCDTLLNLGYAYNGSDYDITYQNEIPAVGFQIIEDGSNFQYNHRMTSFNVIYKSSPYNWDPHFGEYDYGTLSMYSAMKGFWSDGNVKTSPYGDTTKFSESGDPVNKTGWIDGINRVPGDRRFLVTSGPFEIAEGDTQKIVFVQSAALGTDNIDSVIKLKKMAAYLKKLGTSLKPSVGQINVSASSYNNKIILNWSVVPREKDNIENFNVKDIVRFEGYNVYQLPKKDSPEEDYLLVKTFDKVNGIKEILEYSGIFLGGKETSKIVQFGTDNGIERFIELKKDFVNNQEIISGTPYYFKVSSYYSSGNAFEYPLVFENYSEIVTIIPKDFNPGFRYESEVGDALQAIHLRGTAEASVNIIVVDPSEVNGHGYEISFKKNGENKILWDLDDVTENKTVLSNQENINGTDEYIIADGIRIVISQNEENPISENDLYRFTTPKVIYDEEQAKVDVEKINVFPNPYYGYSSLETQKLGNFVMINHLPKKAVIRIFNLAGHLVRTLHKESEDQFYLWDLQNEHQVLAASGLYILHIEMPDLGKVKVLKLAIILGTEVPDFY